MRGRRKEDEAVPPSGTPATPFFARFLEDQNAVDADAKVTTSRERAPFTYKERAASKTTASKKTKASKATASKTKAAAVTKTKAIKAVTLKYPSDNDEYVLYPYKIEAATIRAGDTRQTLKYPSDGDEGEAYVPVYTDAADAPKTAKAKAKKNAQVRLTTKAADIDESAS